MTEPTRTGRRNEPGDGPDSRRRTIPGARRATAGDRRESGTADAPDGSGEGHPPGAEPTAVTDGGRETLPTVSDPEETAFRWGQTEEPRDEDDDADPLTAELDAVERRLERLSETVEHLRILATNASIKLARDEPSAVADIAYEVEADVRQLDRSLAAVEDRVERIRGRLPDANEGGDGAGSTTQRPAEAPDGPVAPRRSDRGPPADGPPERTDGPPERTDGPAADEPPPRDGTGGRASVQLPAGDRLPSGPWRAAGVDLTNWPGHLGPFDFERARETVADAETVGPGSVPTDVAEYSLAEEELPFEYLIALAVAAAEESSPGQGTAGGSGSAGETRGED